MVLKRGLAHQIKHYTKPEITITFYTGSYTYNRGALLEARPLLA